MGRKKTAIPLCLSDALINNNNIIEFMKMYYSDITSCKEFRGGKKCTCFSI